ncbi:universal stress protein [Streptomyces sp. MUM 203J]|uniref:universal stress protein n=1 Tax=Streptomyces sp. MUM 203J TaxID=2791990 RepID=UPI001F04FD7B|nr:universal stress protein [Streptomyces sp. MUM 203J]MCH0540774.1 universal stress protein [Streptomyces sp. MUM 203J]
MNAPERHENSGAKRGIVVGVDPRGGSHTAVAWAADEAARRDVPLRLLLAVPARHDLPQGSRRHRVADRTHRAALHAEGETVLADEAAWVTGTHPGVTVTTELPDGGPAAVLCACSHQALMLVLGSRRLGRSAELFSASSVTLPVSARAACPVAVVAQEPRGPRGPAHLVVGVDGSESSRAALAFALEEAERLGASVRALWVWPRSLLSPGDDTPTAAEERRLLLTAGVAGWPEKHPDVPFTAHVLRGHPVEELALAAQDALALVVGRRGHGGYTGMRLGSVPHGLLHRAECPVVTVPGPGE